MIINIVVVSIVNYIEETAERLTVSIGNVSTASQLQLNMHPKYMNRFLKYLVQMK